MNENIKQQRKRLLDDNDLKTLKKRRHISPEHVNNKISTSKKEKEKNLKSSSRRYSLSIEHINELNLPNWDRISPNIDQILSTKHTQSGVYAHEINLVQQELESLLSISILRENILKDLIHSNNDNLQLKLNQYQQVENIYSLNKISTTKQLLPLINQQQQQRNNNLHLLLDRQVAMQPIINAHIDKIWSDINTYYYKISSNDILNIENIFKFNYELEKKIQEYKNDYQNNFLTQINIIEKLNEENFQDLFSLIQINPLITHYIDRTTIGRFQTNLYQHIPSSGKTSLVNSLYGKSLGNSIDNNSSLRISPRLHPNNRLDLSSLSNFKSDDNSGQLSLVKFKKKSKTTTSIIDPSSSIKFQENIQLVHDYLTDQHLLINDKITRKRKTSITNYNDHCTDTFQSKLSTLISLLHESSSISLCALKRARLQSNNEQLWQKLNTIENDLEILTQKIDMPGDDDDDDEDEDNKNIEKKLDHL